VITQSSLWFMALAVGIFLASRRLGMLTLSYVVLFIICPRLYLGWHWPTDVLMGTVIGIAFAGCATIPAYRNFVWRWVEKAWRSYPGIFAGVMFSSRLRDHRAVRRTDTDSVHVVQAQELLKRSS
jgi:undecaprenyl-diphosphatase